MSAFVVIAPGFKIHMSNADPGVGKYGAHAIYMQALLCISILSMQLLVLTPPILFVAHPIYVLPRPSLAVPLQACDAFLLAMLDRHRRVG